MNLSKLREFPLTTVAVTFIVACLIAFVLALASYSNDSDTQNRLFLLVGSSLVPAFVALLSVFRGEANKSDIKNVQQNLDVHREQIAQRHDAMMQTMNAHTKFLVQRLEGDGHNLPPLNPK
jgi:hypothetical protein